MPASLDFPDMRNGGAVGLHAIRGLLFTLLTSSPTIAGLGMIWLQRFMHEGARFLR